MIFGSSSRPNIQLFVDVRDLWNDIEVKSDLQGLPVSAFTQPLQKRWRTETVECVQSLLDDSSSYIPRDDYRELIDLTLIILGVPNPTYKLKVPGGLHNARWMCKVIYAFKIYLLRKQMRMTHDFYKQLEDFCLFISLRYVKQWMCCPLLRDAAVNDLQFYKNLMSYAYIHHEIAHTAKFNDHLSYLGPKLAAFALFSDKVTVIKKMKAPDGPAAVSDTNFIRRNLATSSHRDLYFL